MSSRAFRRLQKDVEVVRVVGKDVGEGEGDGGEQNIEEEAPGLAIQPRRNLPASNLFALVCSAASYTARDCHNHRKHGNRCVKHGNSLVIKSTAQ